LAEELGEGVLAAMVVVRVELILALINFSTLSVNEKNLNDLY
jgi:hypothetical protein